MTSDDFMTGNEHFQIGTEGAETFVQRFLDIDKSCAPLFLITGRQSFESSGAESFFAPIIANRQVVRFSDFAVNPKIEDLCRALNAFKTSKAQLIIAVGGGSALDVAKLVNYFASTGIDPMSYTEGKRGCGEAFCPLLAVPTTAGTGSEATHFATLYIGFDKISVADKRMKPSHIWLNPAFTSKMSAYLTACTGFDALAQAIESYWAVGSTVESKQYSEKAIKLCLRHLERAVLRPTPEHRAGMLNAAHFAGRAINISKTTAAHAMSYTLTAHYGLPHGHAVAMTLPAVFEANANATERELNDPRGFQHLQTVMTELSNLLGAYTPTEAAKQLKTIIERILLSLKWFTEHGFDPEDVRNIILQEINEERLANNPRKLDIKKIKQIVSNIQ